MVIGVTKNDFAILYFKASLLFYKVFGNFSHPPILKHSFKEITPISLILSEIFIHPKSKIYDSSCNSRLERFRKRR